MSLPPSFEDASHYFEEAITFLRDYQDMYNFANTHVLIEGILEKLYSSNVQNLNVFEEDFQLEELNGNQYIDNLLNRAQNLKAEYQEFDDENLYDRHLNLPLSVKKKHEILYLAKEVKDCCEFANCDLVIDFGSGLGYLDEYIFQTTGHKVLGIECNKQYYVAAKKRQHKYHNGSMSHVKYVRHAVSATSKIAIEEFIHEKFPKYGNTCIVGLHACADLTVDAVNIFSNMADAKSLILMPCCYHKMKNFKDGTSTRFENFPLSETLKSVFEKYECHKFLKIPFLRLATQPPATDEKLEVVVFNLISRAVLQIYCEKYKLRLERKKQKAVKSKTKGDFEVYLKNAISNGYNLKCKDSVCSNVLQKDIINTKNKTCHCNITINLQEVFETWQHYSDNLTFKLAAIFILIQRRLQPIFENFILFDRLHYMKEIGLNKCIIKKIVNEKISPRCYALIGHK